jgi:hypothetical protein
LDEILCEIVTPLHYVAILRRANWEKHEEKRPDLDGHADNVCLCLSEPEIVIRDEDDCDHYFRLGFGTGKTRGCYLHVLVRHFVEGIRDEYVVVSVWFTPDLDEGEVLWFRKR